MRNLLFLCFFMPLISWSQMVVKEQDGIIYGKTNDVQFLNSTNKGLLKSYFTQYYIIDTKEITSFIQFSFRERNKNDLKGGEKVLLKFDDNSILELENNSSNYADYSSLGYYGTFICDITKDQIVQIKDKTLIKLRLGFYTPKDYEIKESQAIEFKSFIQEMLNSDLSKTKKDEIDIYKGF